jgi:alkanesulfonate monooxygenase
MSKIAERGKFDCVFLADGNGVRDMDRPALFAANHPSARPSSSNRRPCSRAVAMVVKHIGVVATQPAPTTSPGWSPAASPRWTISARAAPAGTWSPASNAGDALNFGRAEHMGREDRYARAQEFYEVVAALWDSWADDAFPQDKASGRISTRRACGRSTTAAPHFTVKGR